MRGCGRGTPLSLISRSSLLVACRLRLAQEKEAVLEVLSRLPDPCPLPALVHALEPLGLAPSQLVAPRASFPPSPMGDSHQRGFFWEGKWRSGGMEEGKAVSGDTGCVVIHSVVCWASRYVNPPVPPQTRSRAWLLSLHFACTLTASAAHPARAHPPPPPFPAFSAPPICLPPSRCMTRHSITQRLPSDPPMLTLLSSSLSSVPLCASRPLPLLALLQEMDALVAKHGTPGSAPDAVTLSPVELGAALEEAPTIQAGAAASATELTGARLSCITRTLNSALRIGSEV